MTTDNIIKIFEYNDFEILERIFYFIDFDDSNYSHRLLIRNKKTNTIFNFKYCESSVNYNYIIRLCNYWKGK